MPNKAILVAHGEGGQGTFSIDMRVKTITPANTALTFAKAKEYIASSNAYSEYASTSFGEFGPVNDAQCRSLFSIAPAGTGIVSTNIRRGGDMAGPLVYVLRGKANIGAGDITTFMQDNSITSLVLLACRS